MLREPESSMRDVIRFLLPDVTPDELEARYGTAVRSAIAEVLQGKAEGAHYKPRTKGVIGKSLRHYSPAQAFRTPLL